MTYPPVFPILPMAQTWPVQKQPAFATRTQRGVSGRELRAADQTLPIWTFTLAFETLRDKWDIRAPAGPGGAGMGVGLDELRTLMGFFLNQQGSFLPFLYFDPTDCRVTGQIIGTGDGVTTRFVLNRSLGGFLEPVHAAINLNDAGFVAAAGLGSAPLTIYLNGVAQSVTGVYDGVGHPNWGGALGGVIYAVDFLSPPAGGVAVTADFTFFFPCRFTEDSAMFENFLYQLWNVKQMKFNSLLMDQPLT